MSDPIAAEMLKRFGEPTTWMLSVAEIEEIMTSGPCRHLMPTLEDCRECIVEALTARQMAILAERLGCSPEDAQAVGEKLARKHRR